MSPEYYEYVRLRDVYMRDVAALVAITDVVESQKRLLNTTASRESTVMASHHLAEAAKHLTLLQVSLRREMEQANLDAERVRSEVRGF